MILTCPQCQSQYNLDPGKLGAGGKTVRCVGCHHTWFQAPEPEPVAPAAPVETLVQEGAILSDEQLPPVEPLPELPPIMHNPFGLSASPFGWLTLCLCVFATLVVVFLLQKPVVRHWPQMSLFYKTLGFHVAVPGDGLRISEIVAEQRIDQQDATLMIEGKITNMSEHEIAYPPLYVTLKDGQGVMIKGWKLDAGVIRIASGETAPIMLQLAGAPPEAGKTVEVRVRGE
jgi:predicted Zn finger-like uncharacterized protein